MLPVIEHAMAWLEGDGAKVDIVVLLQPTQPLRSAADVVTAVNRLKQEPCDSVVSVVPLPLQLCPDYVMRIDEEGRLVHFLPEGAKVTRRQDARPAYIRDGTVYAFRAATLRNYRSIYGPVCRPLIIDPQSSVNLDSEEDWLEAERRLGCG